VLSHKAAFRPTPDFSKVVSPRKDLRAFVNETRGAGSRLVFVAAQEEDLRAMERMSDYLRSQVALA
jgi:transcription-repair coupling factor (superfamily II helicase)